MYVSMYVIYIYTHVCICIYTYITCIHVYTHTYIYMHTHTCICYMFVCIHSACEATLPCLRADPRAEATCFVWVGCTLTTNSKTGANPVRAPGAGAGFQKTCAQRFTCALLKLCSLNTQGPGSLREDNRKHNLTNTGPTNTESVRSLRPQCP